MKNLYDVVLRTDATGLAQMLQNVTDNTALVSVHPVREETPAPWVPKQSRFAHGLRNKGVTSQELVLQTLNGSSRPMSIGELMQVFVSNKFAAGSAYSAVSVLVKTGKIRALGDSKYARLDPVTVNYGAATPVG